LLKIVCRPELFLINIYKINLFVCLITTIIKEPISRHLWRSTDHHPTHPIMSYMIHLINVINYLFYYADCSYYFFIFKEVRDVSIVFEKDTQDGRNIILYVFLLCRLFLLFLLFYYIYYYFNI
jgi:hypothetical protein